MEPPLPQEYFGNSVHAVSGEATARELLENDLGWAAWKLPLAVQTITTEWCNTCSKSGYSVLSSFKLFGMGKAVAVRSGYANKFDGKVKYHTQAVEALICKKLKKGLREESAPIDDGKIDELNRGEVSLPNYYSD
ncbi:hypothetical protein glysoja_019575 [Glycine soja]|nr:hypothetical protein glysoja_019575 [Glycine soja]